MQRAGYKTACICKWGLGGFHNSGNPNEQGFDYFFGTPNCPTTDQLYAYMEGDMIPVPPTQLLNKDPLPKHIYSLDNDDGMIAPDFDLEEVDNKFLSKSKEFIEKHSKNSKNQPFFLFHSHLNHLCLLTELLMLQ